MDYQQIRYEVDGPILKITLDRPEKLNAFTGTMQSELIEAYRRADDDDNVRVIIVTGEGRGFCAGADLSAGPSTFDRTKRHSETSAEKHRDGGGLLSLAVYDLKKPLIAAINGPAVGVGATMTLPMDIRIASTQARMGFVFSRRAIVPEACSTYFLSRVVGPAQAAEWFLTGRVFEAEEALRGGLVSRVVAPEDLLPTATSIANEIAENTAPVSVALCRQMMWRGLEAQSPMEMHRLESLGVYWRGQSPDAVEGVASFLEKRKPDFSGRPSKDMPPHYPWWEDPDF
ncbi:MAG: crotonase/enoyl-CoA hydratase family protein [Acidobacteriota bacterium]|nr:crotonase/enoyl-CoA hydratase family protein [Acidobacteriota bacterium]